MKTILIVIIICVIVGCAKAPPPARNTSEAPPIRSTDVVKATPQQATLAAGESGDAVVAVQISKGYHVNANPATFTYLIATQLEIKPGDGISVEFMSYPNALTKKFPFAEKPLAVYEGETILKARLKADKSAKPGSHNLSAHLRVQACDDNVCYAPGTLDVTVPVNIK
jgi:DsbC/DsbD-like thiol-disulfide interchange protein